MDLLYARALPMRHPDVGITLYRRMGQLGLGQRRALPVLNVSRKFEEMKMYGLDLPFAADALVADSLLTRPRADAFLANLESANSAGYYYCAALMHVVGGCVPS